MKGLNNLQSKNAFRSRLQTHIGVAYAPHDEALTVVFCHMVVCFTKSFSALHVIFSTL